ncbi:DUF401 family protein [candidate division KSB1 bacterium]|nr:DUF401 family protein [candidate division KSB1 bacterium]
MESALIWFGFFVSFGLLLLVSRWRLWFGLVVASYVLGLFSLSPVDLWQQTLKTISDPAVLALALAVGLIPIIGGAMEFSGLMDDLVSNLKLKRKSFMAFTSAFIGLLPMPGGALLSAPLLDRAGDAVPPSIKSAINIWFRHVFLLIYPLGALLASSRMANLNLYSAAVYLLPGFVLMLVLGYCLILRYVKDQTPEKRALNRRKLILPVIIILIAPIIHFALMMLFEELMQEIPLLVGVSISLGLALAAGRINRQQFKLIAQKMKPWNFALIILGMFLYLNIFKASETSRVIADAAFSKVFLVVGIGALLGFVTGRVQVPISILLPIYFIQYKTDTVSPFIFAVMFFAVYQGYIISPVHPCVTVTVEYFKTEMKDFYKLLAIPGLIGIALAWLVGSVFF